MQNGVEQKVTGVLLVGGKSRRMGRDKALLEIAGKPMFERVLEAFRENFSRIILVGDRQERFAGCRLPIYGDIYPGSALGGLYTGLVHAETEHVFVAPCDVPFPSVNVIRYLCSLAEGYDVVVPETGEGYEPLFAVYSKTCLPAIKHQLERSNFCVYDFYPKVKTRGVRPEELSGLEGFGSTFLNLNTPDEFEKARCACAPAATVSMTSVLAATAEQVWEMVRSFNGTIKYLPEIAAGSWTGAGAGSTRTVLLKGGAQVVEKVEAIEESEPRSLTYSIVSSPLPVADYLATVQVEQAGGGRSSLTWSGTFKPKGVTEEEAVAAVRQVYRDALQRLENLYGEYYVAEGSAAAPPVRGEGAATA